MTVLEKLETAVYPEDLFDDLDPVSLDNLRTSYIKYMKAVHPDTNPSTDATDLTAKLQGLYSQAVISIESGTFGKAKPIATITILGNEWEVFEKLGDLESWSDRISTSYPVRAITTKTSSCFLTLANHPRDNDLIANEAKILKKIFNNNLNAHGYASHLPHLVDTIDYRENKITRKGNLFVDFKDQFVTLAQAIAMYPNGLPAENVIWIIRRVLDVIGYISSHGIIHGGVIPDNIFIGIGENHEVELHGFYASVLIEDKKPIPLLLADKSLYPPEVLAKEIPTPSVDMYTFASSIIPLIDENTFGARRIIGFLYSLMFASVAARPQNAFEVRNELTKLTKKIWDKSTYIPFMKGN